MKAPHDDDLAFLAAGDRARALAHGVSLNPYSTPGGRALWLLGWEGETPRDLVEGSVNWRAWERGRQARILSEKTARFT
jgi:hypothetical protein